MDFRKTKSFSPEEVRSKALRYCAYQERCRQEMTLKAFEWGLPESKLGPLLSELEREGFIDEKRYAETFARGKFRIKRWGKVKINQALQQKGIPSRHIAFGLSQLDDAEYWDTLEQLTQKFDDTLAETDPFIRRDKIAKKLLARGFESSLVWDLLKSWSFGESE